MSGDAIVAAVIDSFNRQLGTTKAGLKLRGSMDAAQHELLAEILRQTARNLGMAWQADEETGECGLCGVAGSVNATACAHG